MGSGTHSAVTAALTASTQQAGDDPGANLVELGTDGWSKLDDKTKAQLLQEIDGRYQAYLDELYKSANTCVERYQYFSKQHGKWRRMVIIGTGVVAIINLLAANKGIAAWWHGWVPIAAAGVALLLAIVANLESFNNAQERAQAYRESRELFLDAARDYERVWDVYVPPLGGDAQAWTNAVTLYKRIVVKDRELRSKFKELSRSEKKGTGRPE